MEVQMQVELEQVLKCAGVTFGQFLGAGHLVDEADEEPICDRAADGFEADALLHPERYRPLARFVAQRMQSRRIARPYVIEMGAGPGIWAVAAAREMPGAAIVGFDLSADMVRKANRRYAREGLGHRVRTLYQDMRSVHSVHSDKADLVFSRDMLHRLPDLHNALLAMLLAAKPQGEVFVTGFLRMAERSTLGQQQFLLNVAAKAAFPELQRAYILAYVFAHGLADYQRAAHLAALMAGAEFRIWTGDHSEIYLHFRKTG